MNTPTLKTDRLILRRFTEGDLDAFYKIYSDKAANIYLPWFPLCLKEAEKPFMKKDTPRSMPAPTATGTPFA